MRYTLFLTFALLTLGFGLSFKILDLIYISLIVFLFILLDYLYLLIKRPNFYLNSQINEINLFRGESVEVPLSYNYSKEIKFSSPYNFINLNEDKGNEGNNNKNRRKVIYMEINGMKSGIYEIDYLYLINRSVMFEERVKIDIKPKIRVYVLPKSFLIIKEFSSSLTKGYTKPSKAIGIGEDYAYTDKFNSQDDFRRIDWKKTAKYNDIMVKRYFNNVYGDVGMIIDLEATDENSADDLASEALNMIKYSNVFSGNIYIYDGINLKNLKKDIYSAFLQIVEMLRKYYPEVDRLLDYKEEIRGREVKIRNIEDKNMYRNEQWDNSKIVIGREEKRDIKEGSGEEKNIILSQILSEIPFKYPGSFIIQPTKPWVYIDDIEVAYNIRRKYENNLIRLNKLGSKVFQSFKEVLGGNAYV
ncbi:MAG: DUF58 domain-containing protein [Thermoplasmata archaeon]